MKNKTNHIKYADRIRIINQHHVFKSVMPHGNHLLLTVFNFILFFVIFLFASSSLRTFDEIEERARMEISE